MIKRRSRPPVRSQPHGFPDIVVREDQRSGKRDRYHQRWPGANELQVLQAATAFWEIRSRGWSKQSIYPGSSYEFGKPQGQCGVTNFGWLIYLVWNGIARPHELFFEEGVIKKGDGEILGDDHTWALVAVPESAEYLDSRREPIRVDLTSSQFSGIREPLAVEYPELTSPDETWLESGGRYVPLRTVPVTAYDTASFDGRLLNYMRHYVPRGRRPYPDLPRRVVELWWPNDSKFDRDVINDCLEGKLIIVKGEIERVDRGLGRHALHGAR